MLSTKHPTRLTRTLFMVIATQMQYSMNNKGRHFLIKGTVFLARLTHGSRCGYDDVTQESLREVFATWDPHIARGKGQHIRGAIFPSILII
ncbi:MAG TPA: hypothetical protein VIU63_11580 [Nitrospira sp.]